MARDLNNCTLVVRLGKDPKESKTKNGVIVAEFSGANNRDYGETERCNWINFRAYRGLAETILKYLKQGSKVAVTGELTVDQWKDDSGNLQSRAYILATEVQFLDSKNEEGSSQKKESNQGVQQQYNNKSYRSYRDDDDPYAMFNDDLTDTF